MKTVKTMQLTLLLLAGALSGARGEDYRTDINPALLYYQAFLVKPKAEEDYSQYLAKNKWDSGQHLPERFGSAVSNFNAELEFVRQAAKQTVPCNWGVDLSRGPDALLPYLGMAKGAVVDSVFQVMWDFQNGKEAEVRNDLVADLALGRNTSTTRVLIAALVQMAIENVVCATFAENFHRFSPETLQQIEDGFQAAPPRGTIAECEPTFKIINRSLLSRFENIQTQYAGDNDGAMDALHRLFFYYRPDQWEQLTNGSGNTIDGVIQQLRDTESIYPKLAALMALPYREYTEQLPEYQSQFKQTGNGFISIGFPPWEAARTREFAVEVHLAMVRAAIEYQLHGEAGLKSVMDPCGNGPFTIRRFYFNGVDRGFELQSALNRGHGPERIIFVEKSGPAFEVLGDNAGQPFSK